MVAPAAAQLATPLARHSPTETQPVSLGWRPRRRSCKPRTELQKKASYTDMKAMVFLVAATAMAAGYNLLQVARCCVALAMSGRGDMVPGRQRRLLAGCVFSCDQALAYVVLAAVAAAAALQASVVTKHGQPELQWMGISALYGAFCRQAGAGAGVASAVAAGLAAALLAFLSAFNLFRLYGSKS